MNGLRRNIACISVIFIAVNLLILLFFPTQARTVIRGQDRGSEVRELQRKLKSLGYYRGEVDGVFGVKTELSVREFQKENGLTVDGLAGPRTLAVIDSFIEGESERQEAGDGEGDSYPVLRRGDRGKQVLELQEKLQQKGFLAGNLDGIFGLQTELAVRLAQQFYGLKEDGVAGPRTREALNREETAYRTYTVKPGDTLWELGRKWSLTPEEIKAINNLKDADFIKTGAKLKIPGGVEAGRVEIIHWTRVDRMIEPEEIIILTDVESGLSFRVQRLGGSNHADVEPLTAEDTGVFRRIYGGDWSWERRALIAHIDGRQVAASINGQPHATQWITDNKFPGHICLHFKGSKLHKEEKQDNEHQEMVEKAGSYHWPLF